MQEVLGSSERLIIRERIQNLVLVKKKTQILVTFFTLKKFLFTNTAIMALSWRSLWKGGKDFGSLFLTSFFRA